MTSFDPKQFQNKKAGLFAAVAVVTAVFLIFLGFSKHDTKIDGTEFTANRELSQIGGVDQGILLGGSCISKYHLHLIGINSGRRYFAATMDLKGNPANDGQLFDLLATPSCKEDAAKALAGIKDRLSEDTKQDSDVLIYSYRNRSGSRFLP